MGNKAKHTASHWIGFCLTFLGGCFWGFSGACSQFLFTYKGLTSEWLVCWRLLIAGGVMVLIQIIRGHKAAFAVWRNKRDAGMLVAFGLLGIGGCQYTYLTAIQYSNAGTATVLQYLGPALIMMYLCMRALRWPTRLEVLVILLDLVGIFLIATHGSLNSLVLSNEALFWGLIGAVFFAIYAVSPVSLLERYDSFSVVGWGMFVAGIAMMLWKQPWRQAVHLDLEALFFIGCILLFGSILSFTLYIEGVRRIGPGPSSIVGSIEPVSAALFSVFWLGVSLTAVDVIGFACILVTILLLALRK